MLHCKGSRRAGSSGLTENNARFGVMRIMRSIQESQLVAGGFTGQAYTLDKTAPTIGHTFTPSSYTDGAWTNGNVTVACSSCGSGVLSFPGDGNRLGSGQVRTLTARGDLQNEIRVAEQTAVSDRRDESILRAFDDFRSQRQFAVAQCRFEYVFFCDETGHRAGGMEGKLTVTPGKAASRRCKLSQ